MYKPERIATVTVEEAEEAEKERRKALEDIRKRVAKTAAKLKSDGHQFELEESSNEFIIKKEGGRETHLLKSEFYTVQSKDKPNLRATVEEMITADIINPDGSEYETILKIRRMEAK